VRHASKDGDDDSLMLGEGGDDNGTRNAEADANENTGAAMGDDERVNEDTGARKVGEPEGQREPVGDDSGRKAGPAQHDRDMWAALRLAASYAQNGRPGVPVHYRDEEGVAREVKVLRNGSALHRVHQPTFLLAYPWTKDPQVAQARWENPPPEAMDGGADGTEYSGGTAEAIWRSWSPRTREALMSLRFEGLGDVTREPEATTQTSPRTPESHFALLPLRTHASPDGSHRASKEAARPAPNKSGSARSSASSTASTSSTSDAQDGGSAARRAGTMAGAPRPVVAELTDYVINNRPNGRAWLQRLEGLIVAYEWKPQVLHQYLVNACVGPTAAAWMRTQSLKGHASVDGWLDALRGLLGIAPEGENTWQRVEETKQLAGQSTAAFVETFLAAVDDAATEMRLPDGVRLQMGLAALAANLANADTGQQLRWEGIKPNGTKFLREAADFATTYERAHAKTAVVAPAAVQVAAAAVRPEPGADRDRDRDRGGARRRERSRSRTRSRSRSPRRRRDERAPERHRGKQSSKCYCCHAAGHMAADCSEPCKCNYERCRNPNGGRGATAASRSPPTRSGASRTSTTTRTATAAPTTALLSLNSTAQEWRAVLGPHLATPEDAEVLRARVLGEKAAAAPATPRSQD